MNNDNYRCEENNNFRRINRQDLDESNNLYPKRGQGRHWLIVFKMLPEPARC